MIKWVNRTRTINEIDFNKLDYTNVDLSALSSLTLKTISGLICPIYNKTNIINVKKIIEIIKWLNRTRWFNKTRYINKTKTTWNNKTKTTWNNKTKTTWNNKTKTTWNNKTKTTWNNKTIINILNERIETNKKNKTSIELDFNNLFILGGVSLGGLFVFSFTFYVAWKCWLRDKMEDIIITYFIGEDGKSCLEKIIFIKEYLDYLKEIKEDKQDQKEYYGLTLEQIAICKEAKAINKIKYEEALKIRWEKLAETAIRPNDEYHRNLLNYISNDDKKEYEMTNLNENAMETVEEEKNTIIKILPGTPRRRRISAMI
jgi:hypothetical protein